MAPSRVARGCGVLMAVGLLDVAIRLGSGWSMVWVVRAEAALFLATSLGLLMLHLRRREGGGRAEGGTGAGSWSWREPAEPHVLRNGGTTRLIIYEIDWR